MPMALVTTSSENLEQQNGTAKQAYSQMPTRRLFIDLTTDSSRQPTQKAHPNPERPPFWQAVRFVLSCR